MVTIVYGPQESPSIAILVRHYPRPPRPDYVQVTKTERERVEKLGNLWNLWNCARKKFNYINEVDWLIDYSQLLKLSVIQATV